MQISRLGERPEFADIVAERGWTAWWTESGVPLSDYRAHLEPMISGAGIPFALVAHEGPTYVGSALVIESDLDARPQYAPWIAALWVEPERRRHGVAAELIRAARAQASRLGRHTCYLYATPGKGPYYLSLGFERIETDVEGLDVFRI